MSGATEFALRPSTERGHSNHGWLKTFHSFSFAEYVSYSSCQLPVVLNTRTSYYDPQHAEFGSLRVLNEDRVEAHKGFGTHGHREFEIFSYIVSGELQQ